MSIHIDRKNEGRVGDSSFGNGKMKKKQKQYTIQPRTRVRICVAAAKRLGGVQDGPGGNSELIRMHNVCKYVMINSVANLMRFRYYMLRIYAIFDVCPSVSRNINETLCTCALRKHEILHEAWTFRKLS